MRARITLAEIPDQVAYVRRWLKGAGKFSIRHYRDQNLLQISLRGCPGVRDCLSEILTSWGVTHVVSDRSGMRPHRNHQWINTTIVINSNQGIGTVLMQIGWPETPIGKPKLDGQFRGWVRWMERPKR